LSGIDPPAQMPVLATSTPVDAAAALNLTGERADLRVAATGAANQEVMEMPLCGYCKHEGFHVRWMTLGARPDGPCPGCVDCETEQSEREVVPPR
jgi:hypothetical protein